MSEDRAREREGEGNGPERERDKDADGKEKEREMEGHKRREQTRGRVRLCRDGAQPGTGERKSRDSDHPRVRSPESSISSWEIRSPRDACRWPTMLILECAAASLDRGFLDFFF